MMQQLNFIKAGMLEWREVAEPKMEADGDALVRPLLVATCDLDTAVVRGTFRGPFPIGHEGVAEVIDVGDAVENILPGDLVSVPFQISCGWCEACRRGRTAHCAEVPWLSMYGLGPLSGAPWGGFLSDLVRVPFADHMLVPVPMGVDPLSIASLSDNIPDGWRTVGPQLESEPGASVLIVCGGSIALYAAAIAVTLGASRVDFIGGGQRALELAETFGAHAIEGPFPRRLGPYPITVAATPEPSGLGLAIRSTAPDGVCTAAVPTFQREVALPLMGMYSNGIRFVTGRVHARAAMPQVLQLVREGRLRPELVTAQVIRWEEAAEALSVHHAKTVVSRLREDKPDAVGGM